jgi:hypothetical protein
VTIDVSAGMSALTTAWGMSPLFSRTNPVSAMEMAGDRIQAAIVSLALARVAVPLGQPPGGFGDPGCLSAVAPYTPRG